MEFIRSKKGNHLLKDELGYTYSLDKARKSGMMYWRCTKYSIKTGSCKAKIRTLNELFIARSENGHNHLAENIE